VSELHGCQLCPRLSHYRSEQKQKYPDYHCLPVAGFGAAAPRLLIVGLAPGLHGANATGRPFTGDASGGVLFQTLHRFGFANMSSSRSQGDGMQLCGCRITNAVKCVPPQNRPNGEEIRNCNPYLRDEIFGLQTGSIVLALGAIAHRAVLQALGRRQAEMPFRHGAEHRIPGQLQLVDCYHCSRYNFNTGRLNRIMFDRIFERIVELAR
jgi:uracil-DNA glycosylase family 4